MNDVRRYYHVREERKFLKPGEQSWYRWDGGWYEVDGDKTRYCVWDDLGDGAIVFDVGAYEGAWTKRMAVKYPTCQLYAFEPAPRAFGVAKERLAGLDNISLYNFGLSETAGTFTLYDALRDGATFFPNGHEDTVEAEIRNVRDFMESEDIKCVSLMSINIEGGEFELLLYLIEAELICNVERLMIQWHAPTKNACVAQTDIQNTLAKTHEMLWNHGAWEAWRLRSPGSVLCAGHSTCYIPDIS
jgi:FkbM family methyltransferase